MLVENFTVQSPNVAYSEEHITSTYNYDSTRLSRDEKGQWIVTPTSTEYQFRVDRRVPKLGVMLVGLGGNNGTSVMAGILANKHGITWMTKDGLRKPNYWGSLTQSATLRVGNYEGEEVFTPFKSLLPMADPNQFVLGGWDISGMNMAEAMERAKVLDFELQKQLVPYMKDIVPLPGIYDPAFIAANQEERADNVIKGSRQQQVEVVRQQIRQFKQDNAVDKVIILWTANTERYAQVAEGLNDTAENLLASIAADEPEVSPSTLYATAAILEGVAFINGSPQNTFVPGLIELAVQKNVLIGGDDFKSGQTKMKSVLVDFLVGAGLKPTSIVSYNHLGNNDGMNLSAPQTFRSKEISKSNVVDDMVASNSILYEPGEHPDHCIVIKYIPYVGDSKRAMDEYTSEIFLGGTNTIVMHNTCEDSLLAAPIILDLIILAELISRIELKKDGEAAFHGFHPVAVLLSYLTKAPWCRRCVLWLVLAVVMVMWSMEEFIHSAAVQLRFERFSNGFLKGGDVKHLKCIELKKDGEAAFHGFHPVAVLLSYLTKAPLVPQGTPVVNALAKQRAMLENILRACVGLPPENHMMMEFKC